MILAEAVSIGGELLLLALAILLFVVAAAVAYVGLGYRVVRAATAGGASTVTVVVAWCIGAADALLVLLGVANWRDGGPLYLVPGVVHLVAFARGWSRRRPRVAD